MKNLKKGEMSLKVTIVLIVVILIIFLIYNVKDISNFLTGSVALTSNALNEETSQSSEETLTNISLSLVFIVIIGLITLFVFMNYLRKNNKK